MFHLVHYGATSFDPSKFRQAQSTAYPSTKPEHGTGFWCTPEGATYGWKEYVLETKLHKNVKHSFPLYLSPDARVLTINSALGLEKFVWVGRSWGLRGIDWEQARSNYDAIHLTHQGMEDTCSISHPRNLAGWCCECVLILNREAIGTITKIF